MKLDFGCTRLILAKCGAEGLLRNQAAYVLATAWHESGHTMRPVREMGGETYLRSKAYYPYVGMGFVQLTWRRNYEFASKKLGVDFVANPRLLLDPEHAGNIIVRGMEQGWFTGKKLDDYIDLQHSDFVGARRIINGIDRANLIALYATQYDALLKAEGYGEASQAAPAQPPQQAPVPVPVPQPTKVETPPSKPPVAAVKPSAKPAAAAGLFVILATVLATYRHELIAWFLHLLP